VMRLRTSAGIRSLWQRTCERSSANKTARVKYVPHKKQEHHTQDYQNDDHG